MTIYRRNQLYRGAESGRSGETPKAGEVVVTTDAGHLGQRLFLGDGSTAGGHLVGPDGNAAPALQDGAYLWNTLGSGLTGTVTAVADTLILVPVCVPYERDSMRSCDTLAAWVSVAGSAGAEMRIGLYDNLEGTGGPLNLLGETAAMAATGTGAVSGAISSVSLMPGWYWLGIVLNSVASMPTMRSQGVRNTSWALGNWGGAVITTPSAITVAHPFGALPNPIVGLLSSTTADVPIVYAQLD